MKMSWVPEPAGRRPEGAVRRARVAREPPSGDCAYGGGSEGGSTGCDARSSSLQRMVRRFVRGHTLKPSFWNVSGPRRDSTVPG